MASDYCLNFEIAQCLRMCSLIYQILDCICKPKSGILNKAIVVVSVLRRTFYDFKVRAGSVWKPSTWYPVSMCHKKYSVPLYIIFRGS